MPSKKPPRARKAATNKPPTNGHAIAVVLEDLNAKFTVFGEALTGLRENMERQFEQVNQLFEQVDRRFEQVDRRFEQVDRRFEQVDRRFEEIDRRFDRLESAVVENTRAIKRIEAKLEAKVDRAEVVAIVEERLASR